MFPPWKQCLKNKTVTTSCNHLDSMVLFHIHYTQEKRTIHCLLQKCFRGMIALSEKWKEIYSGPGCGQKVGKRAGSRRGARTASEVPLSKVLNLKVLRSGSAMRYGLVQRFILPSPICSWDRLQHPAKKIVVKNIFTFFTHVGKS